MQTLHRHLAIPLHRTLQASPVVALTGPRGSGKAELARREFPGLAYVNLAGHADRARARANPAAFLGSLRGRAIVDEAQRAPELLAALDQAAALLLLAPQRLELPGVPELHLYAPSLAERERRPPSPLAALARYAPVLPARPVARLESWLAGGRRDEGALEQDTRALVGLHDADRFFRFVERAAAASGEVVDQSRWAGECGVTHTTIARWLAALERTFYVVQPRAFAESHGRRLVRRRKVVFLDPAWVPAAKRFESWGTGEMVKSLAHTGERAALSHWTRAAGVAPGVVAETADGPVAVTFTRLPAATPALVRASAKWCALSPGHAACVIVAGEESAWREGVAVRPWWAV